MFETPTVKAVPTKMPAPEYPVDLLEKGVEGIVVVVAVVDETGKVAEAQVKKTADPRLGRAAKQAVMRWKFKPAEKNGRPIRSKVTVPLQFSVED